MELVSAIITTHNRCDDLKKAIESVLKQTYANLELIVVDDASTDNTSIMCKQYENIKYIRIDKEHSKGGNHARNQGILNAKGNYIAFLDDDDIWLPEKIEKQILLFDDENVGMVYSDIQVETGVPWLDYKVTCKFDGDILANKEYWKPICVTSAVLIKKEVFSQVGMFDEQLRYWQEYELTLRIIKKYKTALVREPLVKYKRLIGDKKKLTNNYDGWVQSVDYIRTKHRDLIENLGENKIKFEETVLAESAFRYSAIGNKENMKEEYKKLYFLTGKFDYYIRWKYGISRQDTVWIESFVRKMLYLIRKR